VSDKTAFHSILVPVDGSTLAEAAIPMCWLLLSELTAECSSFLFTRTALPRARRAGMNRHRWASSSVARAGAARTGQHV
jgi:hypothetical protein